MYKANLITIYTDECNLISHAAITVYTGECNLILHAASEIELVITKWADIYIFLKETNVLLEYKISTVVEALSVEDEQYSSTGMLYDRVNICCW